MKRKPKTTRGEAAARAATAPATLARRLRLPDVITLALALLVWRIFFPALMSPDSISQYNQAATGVYGNWHPPLMAIVLHLVLAAGAAIGLLMLAQCMAALFGVRALATGVMRLLMPRLPAPVVEWVSVGILALLLLPISPLPFYAMTFWKDAWAMVFLLWLGAVIIGIHLDGASRRRLAAALALAALFAMVRHNAIVVLPLVGPALWLATRERRPWRIAALLAGPLLLAVVGEAALERLFRVEDQQVESQVMMLDLIGLCSQSSAVCHQLPFTESHIQDQAALRSYHPGDMGLVFWQAIKPVDLAMRTDKPHLHAEYWRAVRTFPGRVLSLKLEGFSRLLGWYETYYFVHSNIFENTHELALNSTFAPLRDWLTQKTNVVAAGRWRWISGVHGIWLAADVAWLLVLAPLAWARSSRSLWLLTLVFLLPLGYYLSYFPAAPVRDYRFMYPSTLFVQCVTLAAALAWLAQKPMGRRP